MTSHRGLTCKFQTSNFRKTLEISSKPLGNRNKLLEIFGKKHSNFLALLLPSSSRCISLSSPCSGILVDDRLVEHREELCGVGLDGVEQLGIDCGDLLEDVVQQGRIALDQSTQLVDLWVGTQIGQVTQVAA